MARFGKSTRNTVVPFHPELTPRQLQIEAHQCAVFVGDIGVVLREMQ